MDKSNLLERFIGLLEEHGVRYCVIGGQAVNAYVEPLVSLDLDVVSRRINSKRRNGYWPKHSRSKRIRTA